MSNDPDSDPQVHPTKSGDGERSTAGTNYGDWRPNHPQRPHGYDFEERFTTPGRGSVPADGDAALSKGDELPPGVQRTGQDDALPDSGPGDTRPAGPAR
jgi:hypothetical protein